MKRYRFSPSSGFNQHRGAMDSRQTPAKHVTLKSKEITTVEMSKLVWLLLWESLAAALHRDDLFPPITKGIQFGKRSSVERNETEQVY